MGYSNIERSMKCVRKSHVGLYLTFFSTPPNVIIYQNESSCWYIICVLNINIYNIVYNYIYIYNYNVYIYIYPIISPKYLHVWWVVSITYPSSCPGILSSRDAVRRLAALWGVNASEVFPSVPELSVEKNPMGLIHGFLWWFNVWWFIWINLMV